MSDQTPVSAGQHAGHNEEIDIHEHAELGKEVPHAKTYRIRIDGTEVRVNTDKPNGEELLAKVGKRPCAYELIAEYKHRENAVIEPSEVVNLREHGLRGFITAHKEIVTIIISADPYQIERGERTVAEILGKVGKSTDGFMLLEEKDGPPMPLPENKPVKIHGCEVFHVQVKTGGSS